MATELIINATLPETRIALLESNEIQELHVERDSERGIVGNIYKGKVIRVLPGMQAAFIDIGLEKAAFLYVDDVYFPDMTVSLASNPIPEIRLTSPVVPSSHRIERNRYPNRRGPIRARRNDRPPPGNRQQIPIPRTPEDHARLQREYGKLMLELGAHDTSEEETKALIQQSPDTHETVESPQVLDSNQTSDSQKTDNIPAALEPDQESAELVDATVESAAVYHPDPLMDVGAWKEDLLTESAEKPIHSKGLEGPAGSEEQEDEEALPVRHRVESANIADLVKEGQEILVQVVKDPIGTKGARLTCHISLPGRYLVFMPTVDHVGVSRRIDGEMERRRLKELMSQIRPTKTGVIVRTASGNQQDKKLKADLDFLIQTWNEIQKKFQKQKTGTIVYQDLNIILRAIRDMFSDDVDRVVIDSKREYKSVMKFVMRFMPHIKDKIVLYTEDKPVFDKYGIEAELLRAFERKVWLKSGGYLVIDQAEALVAIDINTGRYVGKSTLEETILKTNLEAVEEIAYQLRIRNCGGIIIIDFIDMEKESNREKVYQALEVALKKDRARPTILKISQLGLVEMTRKRTRDTIVRSLCEPCRHCDGRGYLKNKLTVAYDIMREIQREGSDKNTQALTIQCHPSVADVLLEDKRDVLEDLEHQYQKKISVRANGAYHIEQYELVAHRDSKNIVYSSDERKQALRKSLETQKLEQQKAESHDKQSSGSIVQEKKAESVQGNHQYRDHYHRDHYPRYRQRHGRTGSGSGHPSRARSGPGGVQRTRSGPHSGGPGGPGGRTQRSGRMDSSTHQRRQYRNRRAQQGHPNQQGNTTTATPIVPVVGLPPKPGDDSSQS